MKKLSVLILALCLILGLAACGGGVKQDSDPLPETLDVPDPEPTPDGLTAEDLSGYWHISDSATSMSTLRENFPESKKLGACMEIRPNGQISWYIGEEGATGSFQVSGDLVEAVLTGDPGGDPLTIRMNYSEKNGRRTLTMDVKCMLVYWIPGKGEDNENWPASWKLELESALWESEGIRPLSYQALGDGIYQIYVEQAGQAVPWAKVDSATGELLPDE